MTLYKNKYRIETARLKGWDYSNSGWYFITVCTKRKECLLGKIADDNMQLSEIGKIANKYWQEIPQHFPDTIIDEYVIMPNHVHGIVIIEKDIANMNGGDINNTDGGDINVETQNFASLPQQQSQSQPQQRQPLPNYQNDHNTNFQNKFGAQSRNLGSIIRGFKSAVKKYATMNNINFTWQTRFHDHIIRDERELLRILQYIRNNPSKWDEDKYFGKTIDE